MLRTHLLLAAAAALVSACAKPAPPSPPAENLENVRRYELDDTEGLRRYCLTDGIEGCSAVEKLAAAEAELRDLHAEQVAAEQEAVERVLDVLKAPDETPVMRITAIPLEPDTWSSKDQEVPATLEVRSEVPRGFDAMGEGTKSALRRELAALRALHKGHTAAFKDLEKRAPRSFVVPADIAKERAPAPISASVVEGNASFEILSAALADQEFERVAPWVAVVSFVITEDGLPFRAIDDHELPMPAAVEVALSESSLAITERVPKAGKTEVESTIPVAAVCDTLRGEVRYRRADTPLRLQASFLPAKAAEGGN